MTLLSAWLVSAMITWPILALTITLLINADWRHEDQKHERWRAEGIYWPESVDTNEPLPPWARGQQ